MQRLLLLAQPVALGADEAVERGDGVLDTLRAAAHLALELLLQVAHQPRAQLFQLRRELGLALALAGGQDEQPQRRRGHPGDDPGEVEEGGVGHDGDDDADAGPDAGQPGVDHRLPRRRRQLGCLARLVVASHRLARRPADGVNQPLAIPGQRALARRVADDAAGVGVAPLAQVVGHGRPLAQVLLHHPVHQFVDAVFDLARRVGHHFVLEVLLQLLGAQQVGDAAQAQPVVEEVVAALLHRQQQIVDLADARLEVALHVVVVVDHLAADVVQQLAVARQRAQVGVDVRQLLADEPAADAQRIEQLQPEAPFVVQRLADVALQRLEAARPPLLRLAALSRLGQPGRDGEDGGHVADERLRRAGDEGHDLIDLGRPQDVDLVDDQDDLLAPVANLLQEAALALGEGAVGRGDEEDEVAAGDELSRQRLVLAHDGVRAGRVHDGDLAKQLHRRGLHPHAILARPALGRLAVAQQVDLVGRRRHALRLERLAEQGVDESRLAGVELAGDDQQEQLVQLANRIDQSGAAGRVGGAVGQRVAQAAEGVAGLLQQRFLRLGQDRVHEEKRTADYADSVLGGRVVAW